MCPVLCQGWAPKMDRIPPSRSFLFMETQYKLVNQNCGTLENRGKSPGEEEQGAGGREKEGLRGELPGTAKSLGRARR